jgi:predicted membrane protein
MKMNAGIIGGIILILLGLSLVVKIVFNIDFPVFKLLLAFLFIYFGLRIMLGGHFRLFNDSGVGDEQTVVFGERTFNKVEDGREYSVIFGSAIFDLTNYTLADNQRASIKINTVFGGTRILLSPSTSVRLNATTAFGGTKAPDGNSSAFGDLKYETDSLSKDKPRLEIEANTVFGGLEVKKR